MVCPYFLMESTLIPKNDFFAAKMQEQEHFQRNEVQAGPPRYELLTDTKPNLFIVQWSSTLRLGSIGFDSL